MKMVDLKMPKKSKEQLKKEMSPIEVERDRWPYGMQLRFESEQVDKLPYLKKLKVGQKVMVEGMGEVSSVRMNEDKGGKQKYSVEIQLHEVGCEGKGKEKSESIGEMMGRHQKEYTG